MTSRPTKVDPEPARIWIAWETQRRSLNLSRRVGARLFILEGSKVRAFRYVQSGLKTLKILFAGRRQLIFVQNPSMILASLACLLKPWLGYSLVVDRHSNFQFGEERRRSLTQRILSRLSAYTIRAADLTVVTNRELATRVTREGGRAFVLPDPFPELNAAEMERSHVGLKVLFVCSWAWDEPIAEVVEACRSLEGRVTVFASGRPKKSYAPLLRAAPANFVSTGFLPDPEYFRLMAQVDAVMVITRRPATLVCGAYEAISLGKPLILGDSTALREYFDRGAVYSDCSPPDLAHKIEMVATNLDRYRKEIEVLYATRSREWDARLAALDRRLTELTGRGRAGVRHLGRTA